MLKHWNINATDVTQPCSHSWNVQHGLVPQPLDTTPAYNTRTTSKHQRVIWPDLYRKLIEFIYIVVWHMRVSTRLLDVTWLECALFTFIDLCYLFHSLVFVSCFYYLLMSILFCLFWLYIWNIQWRWSLYVYILCGLLHPGTEHSWFSEYGVVWSCMLFRQCVQCEHQAMWECLSPRQSIPPSLSLFLFSSPNEIHLSIESLCVWNIRSLSHRLSVIKLVQQVAKLVTDSGENLSVVIKFTNYFCLEFQHLSYLSGKVRDNFNGGLM